MKLKGYVIVVTDIALYTTMYIRLVFHIAIFSNYFYLSKGNSEVNNKIYKFVQTYTNVSILPINSGFTDDGINKNTQEYLAGLKNEDVFLNGTQLIQKYGYKVEVHRVITSDGYILSLYRIPGKGKVIFLMHGLFSSYVDWLTVGAEKSLAFLLAALGFDVWMGNSRGNNFSQENIHFSSSNPKFWDYSWDEIGRFDLPAMIDYTLKKTGQDNLTYIGHSQGTTAFFVMCSELLDCDKKINFMIALAPVAWMKHAVSPLLRIAAAVDPFIYELGKALGVNNVLPDTSLKKILSLTFCGNSFLAAVICQNLEFIIGGFDYFQINFKQLPVIFNHNLSGSSLKQVEHYVQLVNSGCFRKYDHGTFLNLVKYGSPTPPSYPVEKITVPIAMFYSYGDWLASPIDVNVLRGKLKNVVEYSEVPLRTFNHLDYLWANDVKTLLYDKILELVKNIHK